LWQNSNWQKGAHDWIRSQAEHNSIRLTGEIKQFHIYHWSTVMRVPSTEGTLFFKATAPETTQEIALTQKLAEWYPQDMPELVAVDIERGWMLMRDGGEPLRASIRPTKDIKLWEPVIKRYAELQIGLAKHADEILAFGIPDHRLASLPHLYSQLLTDEESLMIGQEKGLTPYEFRQLQNLKLRFEEICAELAAFDIPESINHGDFHDGNVLIKNGRITFFDWGDADVTHPFVSLRTFFVSIEMALDLDDYVFTPEMAALLDRYLEPFQKCASGNDLLKAYTLSKPVASIVKTLAWHQSITQMDDSIREEYSWIVPEVLREFLYHEKRTT
jgi:aminoglycoside/choline kinase family phosphotransferase